ncbi:hypothetical protein [Microbacterium sp. 16-032]|jgi:hypothetical protein|uniref:hypothetical protein n=1 Tax=Microbacterium sp. 16-032 TaxID=3239808 RepID=UPI0034E22078
MTPEAARSQIEDLYEASAAAIAPNGWEIVGSWLDCSPSSSDLRVRWTLSTSRVSPLPGAPADLIARAQRAWQERGHRVTVERDTNLTPPRWILSDPPYLTGTHPDGSFFTLNIGEGLAYFDATSACVPGDILQLNARTPSP